MKYNKLLYSVYIKFYENLISIKFNNIIMSFNQQCSSIINIYKGIFMICIYIYIYIYFIKY